MTNNNQKPPISEEKALSRMMHICARKEYCTHDIEQKLKRLQIDDEAIERIITKLLKNRFVDNERYTRSYVSDKLRFSKWGKTKITYHLRHKRINDKTIEEVFSEFSNKQLTDALEPIIIKKLKSTKADGEYELRNKVIRYALGRGFNMDDIINCLNRIKAEQ